MGAVSAGTGSDKIKGKRILRTKKHHLSDGAVFSLERAMGVEPTSKAWEAFILPMNYARSDCYDSRFRLAFVKHAHSSGRSMARSGMMLRDVADEDAQDARHDLGSNAAGLCGTTTSARMAVSEVR